MSFKSTYDYLLVGAGLFNAVFANEATKIGKKCLVVEKRDHLGGNLYCKSVICTEDLHVILIILFLDETNKFINNET